MVCLEKMLNFDDFTSLYFFLCQEREFVYYLEVLIYTVKSSSTGVLSDTSEASGSDHDLARIGYSYWSTASDSHLIQLSSSPVHGSGSPFEEFQVDSHGAQTLASLKQEAIADKQKVTRGNVSQ